MKTERFHKYFRRRLIVAGGFLLALIVYQIATCCKGFHDMEAMGQWNGSYISALEAGEAGKAVDLIKKRHCGTMTELTDNEWEDLRKLICKVETCLKTVLGATLCN